MDNDDILIPFPGAEEMDPTPEEGGQAAHSTFLEEPMEVLLLAVDLGEYDAERSLDELSALAEANNMRPVAEILQKRAKPDPATKLGAGRLAEAKLLAQNLGAKAAIFDGELSGSQLRNLEDRLQLPVLDRTMLILEIFAGRATTREGKTQTELATLKYRLPRLAGHGTSLSRQGGGGGGGGGARRGGGETKLEYDRRYINQRIAILRRRLVEMQARRNETRRARDKSGVPLVALVGYTNVGKSSLVNALAGSDIAAADMLFATLDPTARRLTLPDGQAVVLVDTVGFVSRLPHDLVDAFKSTLEEARYADLLLMVCDASDPESAEQLAVTSDVLASLQVDKSVPRITVYNKCDKAPGLALFDEGALAVSAKTGQGLPQLLDAISHALSARMCRLRILLPYEKLALADVLRQHGNVLQEDFRDNGVFYSATLEAGQAHLFAPFLLSEDSGEAAEPAEIPADQNPSPTDG